MPGKIQIAEPAYELVKDGFVCTPRGLVDVKGKGEMKTWFLEGVRTDASSHRLIEVASR